MTPNEFFRRERDDEIAAMAANENLISATRHWVKTAQAAKYSYHFEWQGRPVIQYPQDLLAMHELIWQIRPDLIIETGIAHGGSLVFSASMLALLDVSEAISERRTIEPHTSARKVLGIEIDIRTHNRAAIEAHPMASRIQMIEGSSIDPRVIEQVKAIAQTYKTVLVCLDSNHTHEHVLEELEAYAPLTSVGSYCVVFDTFIEHYPKDFSPGRPWGPGNNPMTAVHAYLEAHPEFSIDKSVDEKLMITVAPNGYLKRIRG